VSRPLVLASSLAFVTFAPPSAARLYRRDPPRVELALESAFVVFDSDSSFDSLDPVVLFGLAAGIHVLPDVRAGVVVRATLSDPEADRVEVLADLTWSWVDEPRLPEPPTLRLAVALEAGWQTTELHGSDFVVNNDGFLAALGLELGIVVFEDVALSAQLSAVAGPASNGALEDWAPSLRAGLTLATLL
jgi:hypothetical protein